MEVSIVMCAYNAARYICEAIESVLHQTYQDFELVVIDDGSNDNTSQIVGQFKDERIRLYVEKHDYVASLNKAIRLAKGDLIFHMDADDIMHPERLRMQTKVMETLPDIDVCGSWMTAFTSAPNSERLMHGPSGYIGNPEVLLIEQNFVFHPTVCFRKKTINSFFYKDYPCAEDYKLWCEMAMLGCIFYILDYPLVYYRLHGKNLSSLRKTEMNISSLKIQDELISELLSQQKDEEIINFLKQASMLQKNGKLDRKSYLWLASYPFKGRNDISK